MSRLIFASALALLAAAGMAWGSKPAGTSVMGAKPGATTVQDASPGGLTRTVTGRPANLDPRIPWLADLGIPQSGGPEPLVPVREFRITLPGSVNSVVEMGNDVVVVVSNVLARLRYDGTLAWSRTLSENAQWVVVKEAERLFAVPLVVDFSKSMRPEVVEYTAYGEARGTFSWPLPSGEWNWLSQVKVDQGVLIGAYSDGRRIHVRLDPRSTVDPEIVVTTEDVEVGGADCDPREYQREYANGRILVGVKPAANLTAQAMTKRRGRARGWAGRKLTVGGLPFFGKPESPGGSRPDARADTRGMARMNDDGTCWLFHQLTNVRGRSWREYVGKEFPGTEDCWMLSEHRRDGEVRSYLILPGNAAYFLIADDVYIPADGKLVRWEHIR